MKLEQPSQEQPASPKKTFEMLKGGGIIDVEIKRGWGGFDPGDLFVLRENWAFLYPRLAEANKIEMIGVGEDNGDSKIVLQIDDDKVVTFGTKEIEQSFDMVSG